MTLAVVCFMPYNGKFSYGANFRIFRMCLLCAKIKIRTFKIFTTLKNNA